MVQFLIKRILLALLIVWGVLTLTFILLHLAPGDPLSIYVTPDIPPEVIANMKEKMGLDRPVGDQYFLWMREFVRGNFGTSLSQKRPVSDILSEAIPNTLQLTLAVFFLQLVIGTLLGALMALKRGSRLDSVLNSLLLAFYSVPGFWLALMAVLLFSYQLGWLPSGQMHSLGFSGNGWQWMLDRLRHLVLPVLVLLIPFLSYTARFMRGSFCDVLDQPYIRTALAYGHSHRMVYFRYALKNALLPLVTLVGLYLPFLLGGAVIIEYIFSWPGMGRVTVEAIFAHDFPVILASTWIAALAVVTGNLLSDLLYFFVDPRIKLGGIR